ncbi:MAG: AMP-binding protein, partial [Spirochaetales bacterium]|nr:AMP-binding protein [Spirochaetales bacterium]
MKLAFSTRNVSRTSFKGLCRLAADYGMDGFEIWDAVAERKSHSDSVLRSEMMSEGRILLRNNDVEVCALSFPEAVESEQASGNALVQYVDMAALAGIENIIVHVDVMPDAHELLSKYGEAVRRAERQNVGILFETSGPLARTQDLLEIINVFASAAVGAAWNIRETFFNGGESAETTIKTLGAYIRYVRIGDRLDDTDVLIGEGTLPVDDFLRALRSLNYEGFFTVDWNDEVTDADIVLTHFENYISRISGEGARVQKLYENRSHTGTFPWKKFEVIDATFGDVLDTMAETYPDQYAFKYTTLDYTRTYREFRRDVDRVAAAFISLGVKPGYHVAVWATNIPAWFLTFWAATKIGAVLVTVNTAYKIHEAEYLLRQSDTHTLVMIESVKESNYKQIIQELCPELSTHKKGEPLFAKKLPFLRNVITVGF